MKSRSSTTEIGRRRRLLAASTLLFFAAAVNAADAETTGTTATATTGDDSATSTGADSATSTGAQAGTISVTGTTLPELVTETEPCAVLCYNAACLDSGCSPGDFDCVCDNPHSLVVKMGLCVGRDCDNARQFDSGDWIADVCNVFDKKPSSADISSASALIISEISEAAATATNNPVPSTGTISNGDSTTAAEASDTGTTSSAAGRPSILRGCMAGGLLGLTSVVVGLVGGAAVIVAAAL